MFQGIFKSAINDANKNYIFGTGSIPIQIKSAQLATFADGTTKQQGYQVAEVNKLISTMLTGWDANGNKPKSMSDNYLELILSCNNGFVVKKKLQFPHIIAWQDDSTPYNIANVYKEFSIDNWLKADDFENPDITLVVEPVDEIIQSNKVISEVTTTNSGRFYLYYSNLPVGVNRIHIDFHIKTKTEPIDFDLEVVDGLSWKDAQTILASNDQAKINVLLRGVKDIYKYTGAEGNFENITMYQWNNLYQQIISLKPNNKFTHDLYFYIYDESELNTKITELGQEVNFGNVDIINNYYINPQGKIGQTNIGFYTEPIFLKQGETITYSIKGVDCAILSTYSLGKYTPVVIAPSDYTETYTDKTYTAATDGFIVFSGQKGSLKLQKTSSIKENAERIEHLEDVVNIKPYVVNNGKYITPKGIIKPSNNGFYTEPIFLKQGEIIKFSIKGWACSILSLYNNGEYTPLLISNIGKEESLNNIQYIASQDEYVVFSGTPNTLILTSSVSVLNDRISALENKENSISAVSYGSVKNDGTIDSSVRTSLLIRIEGGKGFYIKLNPGFRFIAAHLYDDNSNEKLQSYFCGGTNSWIPLKYDNYSSFGQDTIIAGQHLLVVVSKSDNSTISNDEFKNVIKTFCYLNDSQLHRWVLEDNWFLFAHKRMRCLSNIQWKALEYVKPVTSTFSSYRFLKGENYISVPYSDTSEKMKYVGMQVSPYTFVTAAMNKRSVVYTEDINPTSPHSEYGIVYDAVQSACRCFYGSVCSSFTAAIMGLPLVYLVSSYNEGAPYPVPNLTTIVNANANNVRPLDLIYYQGHISIISDIYKDDYGRVKYILWAEYNYPNVWINVYTSEVFEERLSDNNAVVRRYSDWGNTCTDINIPDCVPAEFNDYARTLDIEKDLHVFTGDKSSFSLDDPIYLNINRTPGYNTLLVYKDNAENPTFTIDISGIESDYIYPEDTDDWCIYNMRLQTLTYGKYKARLSDGNGNYSGYVYFEIVDSGASLNIENGVITSIEFTASNATPIAVVTCNQDYYQKAVKIPTSSEIENKVIALNWSKSSAKYINLLLRGDYGVVYKRFKLN